MKSSKSQAVCMLGLSLLVFMLIFSAGIMARANQAPLASFVYSPEIPAPEETITFDASSSHAADGSIVRYAWDFGDGTTASSPSPTAAHAYQLDGNYTVQLTVTDNAGAKGFAAAVVQVQTIVFFRVVALGGLTPISNVSVTVYYSDGHEWVKAPVGPCGLEIKYDQMTQPDLADTAAERYRNPVYTASLLRSYASNVGLDIHPATWKVYFKFEQGSYVAYWPNDTARVYTYKSGVVESHDYLWGHAPHWDPTAGTYVIDVDDIPKNGVSPVSSHPIIIGLACPPPTQKYYLTVRTDPSSLATIPGEGWHLAGSCVTLTAPSYVDVSSDSRYRFGHWDVDNVPQGLDVNPISVYMNANHTATAHYVLQYLAVFKQTGLSSDANDTVVTVNGAAKTFSQLPYSVWVDCGGSISYSYASTVSSSTSGKRFRLTSVAGPSSPITVTGAVNVVGDYVPQYSVMFRQSGLDLTATGTVVTVNGSAKALADLPYCFWVDSGQTVVYSYSPDVASTSPGKRFSLGSVSGVASPITVCSPTTVTGNYLVQYSVTFGQTGLDATATGIVMSVNGSTKTLGDLPFTVWVNSGESITYSYNDLVLSATSGKRFKQASLSGPSSPITVTGAAEVTCGYKTQHQVLFDQTGVGADFGGAIATVDSIPYDGAGLPASFWWDKDSSHSFAFNSPLVVNGDKQYLWSSTSGLSTQQSATLTVTASGSVLGNYAIVNRVTFDQVGVGSDFAGTVVSVDGVPYTVGQLPTSFMWQMGSTHTFAFQSPLLATANAKQYVWTGTAGLSVLQSGTFNVTGYGSIVGNCKTQYYLTLSATPSGAPSPSGQGWYDAGTYAPISASVLADIVPGSSRYSFAGWTTSDMAEIVNPASPSTSVYVDKAKTVTANYAVQYAVTFGQSGVGTDFDGQIVTIDGAGYSRFALQVTFWWDSGSSHTFTFHSPLVASPSKHYNWFSTSGLSDLQSGVLNVTCSGSVIGNYSEEGRFYVTFSQTNVGADFAGTVVVIDGSNYALDGLPVSFWWNAGSVHTFAFQSPLTVTADGKQYAWTATSGLSNAREGSLTVTSSGTVIADYKTQYYLSMTTNPTGVGVPSGGGWQDAETNVQISTSAFVDDVPGSSRYRFNGWTTVNMSEIADPTRSPTTVLVDEIKTVTATYALQFKVTFTVSGVGSDYAGTVLTVDGAGHGLGGFPAGFWWDGGTSHSFMFSSPLFVNASRQYLWSSTSGLTTQQGGTLDVSAAGSVAASYVPRTLYALIVTADVGGTTDPSPGSYMHQSGSSVQVKALPATGYVFDHWELDGVNTSQPNPCQVAVDRDHTLRAVFKSAGAPLSVSIRPLSGTIHVRQSIPFTSTITGGSQPYRCQWYLNNSPVADATGNSWVYTPHSASYHYIYLVVTDDNGVTAQSETAKIEVLSTPVGGTSVSVSGQAPPLGTMAYVVVCAVLWALVSVVKRKRR